MTSELQIYIHAGNLKNAVRDMMWKVSWTALDQSGSKLESAGAMGNME
jgi:hypothetical protein